MKKEELEREIALNKSTYKIAEAFNCGQSTVNYWLKKYNLKTEYGSYKKGYKKPYICKICGDDNPDNFNKNLNRKCYCRKCDGKRVSELQIENKKKIVSYKGGKCKICKYDKYYGALQLHHLNPEDKDPNFKGIRNWKWDRIQKEIDKCILVCGNCHTEIHAGLIELNEM